MPPISLLRLLATILTFCIMAYRHPWYSPVDDTSRFGIFLHWSFSRSFMLSKLIVPASPTFSTILHLNWFRSSKISCVYLVYISKWIVAVLKKGMEKNLPNKGNLIFFSCRTWKVRWCCSKPRICWGTHHYQSSWRQLECTDPKHPNGLLARQRATPAAMNLITQCKVFLSQPESGPQKAAHVFWYCCSIGSLSLSPTLLLPPQYRDRNPFPHSSIPWRYLSGSWVVHH